MKVVLLGTMCMQKAHTALVYVSLDYVCYVIDVGQKSPQISTSETKISRWPITMVFYAIIKMSLRKREYEMSIN